MDTGTVMWKHNRTFIVGKVGHKWVTGLVVEADGCYASKARPEELVPCLYRGKPYPPRKARGHLRKMKPQTKAAKKIRREVLA